MKNTVKILVTLMLLATVILAASSCAADGISSDQTLPSANGAIYEISEDKTHVTIIGYSYELHEVNIPAEIEGLPVTEIAKSAFTNNEDLYRMIIPDTVTTIGEGAFRGCESLLEIKLPSGLTQLPADCFRNCYVLETVSLPDTLTTIGDRCFEGCTKLGEVRIPSSVTSIGYDAFMYCESIYLDVTANPYAAGYAMDNSINTEFSGTSAYFWMMMGIGTAIALAIMFIAAMIFCAYIRKHPEHNPNIFIFRVLGKIYNALSWLYHKTAFCIVWLLTHLIWAISEGIKWLKEKLSKKKKRPSKRPDETDDRTE